MIYINKLSMKTRYILMGIMSLVALSCTEVNLEKETYNQVEMTFSASMEDDQDTKTVLQSDQMSI